MAVKLETLLERSVKNMGSGIHPVVKESALEMIRRAYAEGIYVQISAGYRSMTEQARLYGQGRLGYTYQGVNYSNMAKPIVTNAEPGESYHNFGLAVDFFIVSDDGRSAIWTVDSRWRRVAAIGKELGFAWGGDWTSFKDYPHLEMTGGLTYRQLQAGQKPALKLNFNNAGESPLSPANPVQNDDKPQNAPQGNSVIKGIQLKLNSRYKTNLTVDGLYGPQTKKALVTGFQTELNKQYNAKLSVDGIWGPKTKAAVRNVRKGAKGNITYILQAALYMNSFNPGNIDGIFGPDTEQALKSFQKARGLRADGIAGKETFEELFQ
ncbi:peptidoglycan-binding protein [Bacillus massiliglaciei]|uniref:peptidoglycan-binding protein n=1 Tax=Bacillus massiliglaciei TaxID=1816693 RepID=UPI000A9E662D|nr:peptidoglycan-binding protein [Bacillus massiliglaciei]